MADDRYLIWSEEHGAWWRPNESGYTRSMRRAGRYSEERARAISASAKGGGTFCEVPVRESLAISHACTDLKEGGR